MGSQRPHTKPVEKIGINESLHLPRIAVPGHSAIARRSKPDAPLSHSWATFSVSPTGRALLVNGGSSACRGGGRYCRTREQPFPRDIGHFPQVPGTAPLTKRTESSSQVNLAPQTGFEPPTCWLTTGAYSRCDLVR